MRLRVCAILTTTISLVSSAFAQQLTTVDAQTVINRAVTRALQISPNSVIAVVDREGFVLGVWTIRGGEPTAAEIANSVSKAGTAAFLSSNQNAFTSRTAGFIIQQHFPPGVINTAPGPLVGVGLSNLFFSDINKFKKTSIPPPGSIPLFDATPGMAIVPVPATSLDGAPGGVPLYKNGQLVGGVGVTGDGTPPPIPGFRDENPLIFVDGYDRDEDVALAGQHGFQPSSSITADNVYINGLALPYVESSTLVSNVIVLSGNASAAYPIQGAPMAFPYPVETFGGVQGEVRQPITNDPLPGTINGQARLNETEVRSIINYAADRARTTRAGIRLPIGIHMEVFITVVNNPNQSGVAPTVLGTFRTGEATMFSWDVAVQKARTALYYSSRDLLGFGRNIAMSTRTVGFLAQSHYPPGIDGNSAGPFFSEQDALPVRRISADANIGRDREVRRGIFHGVDRASDDVVALAREQRELVLAVRRSEDQETRKACRRRFARIAHQLRDREALQEWHVRHALAVLDARRNDDRLDESADDLGRFERAGPQRVVTEPAADQRRWAHRRMVRAWDGSGLVADRPEVYP